MMTSTLSRRAPLIILFAAIFSSSASAQDVDQISVAKFKLYEQMDPGVVQLTQDDMESPLGLEANVSVALGGTVNSATVTPPGGSPLPLTLDLNEYLLEYGTDLPAELEVEYPNGTYTFNIDSGSGPIVEAVDLVGDAYPNPPRLTNFTQTQSINAGSAFTLTWDAFSGGSVNDFIEVVIESNGIEVFTVDLDGTATSLEIPASTLASGRIYDLDLTFIKVVDVSVNGTVAAYASSTFLEITTSGTPIESNVPWIDSFAPFNGQLNVPVESVVVIQFNEKMSSVIDIAWSGGGIDTNNFTYTWNDDKRTLYCIYNNPAGLPQGAEIQWQINPGESGIMRDIAGNSLGEQTNSFTTAAVAAAGANDVDVFFMLKTQILSQTGASPDHTGWYLLEAGFELNNPNSVTNVSAVGPGSSLFDIRPEWIDEELERESGYTDKTNLDNFFPAGTYDITIDTAHNGQKAVQLVFPGDNYPNDPTVTNLPSLNGADPTNPIVINWDPFVGADATSAYFISVSIFTDNDFMVYQSPEQGEPGGLDGTSTSVTLPADTLDPGRTYLVELEFGRIVDTDTTNYSGSTAAAMFGKITEFEILTGGNVIQPEATIGMNGGSATIQVSGGHYTYYRIEGSTDLVNWHQINYAQTAYADGITQFTDPDRLYFSSRYYRATKITEEQYYNAPPVSIQGTVRNFITLEPVPGATVGTSLDGNTTMTDENGSFFLQTSTSLGFEANDYSISITKEGFNPYSQLNFWGDAPRSQLFELNPF